MTIATNLTNNATNTEVNSLNELNKFIAFAGGSNNVFMFIGTEWITVTEFLNSNTFEGILN